MTEDLTTQAAIKSKQVKARRLPLRRRMGYTSFVLLLPLMLFEFGLRATGFEWRSFSSSSPRVMVEGELQDIELEPCPNARWKPKPGAGVFNADGFQGPIIPHQKQPGVLRVATLGDSCTHWGKPPYPEFLREELQRRTGGKADVLNAGVVGYSSEQGVYRLEHIVLPYRPDIVTIYFGWNDHWNPHGATDRARMTAKPTFGDKLCETVEYLRIGQACFMVCDLWDESRPQREPYRVTLEQYRENFTRMVALCREHGADPILITPVTNDWKVLRNCTREVHEEYVAITRDVSRTTNARLIDAAELGSGRTDLVTNDCVHLTPEGHQWLSNLLADAIAPAH